MTEKRFTLRYIEEQHLSANLYDDKTFICSIGIGAELIVELLNNLSEDNVELRQEKVQLKSELKELTQKKNDLKELLINSEPVLEQKKLQKIIYKIVYSAIDDKIKEAEESFQQTYDEWYQGQIDALKELKKELQE